MLSHLLIKNFAVIDHLEIPFEQGLTVLTGETGAGKSIIINALNLLLAGRANTDVVRTGFQHAEVEGIFELNTSEIDTILEAHGIAPSSGQLVIKRVVSRNGRNKIFINGNASTLAILGKITHGLVDISGQHEHVSLMHPDRHLNILDAYAGLEKLRSQMKDQFSKLQLIKKELSDFEENVRTRLNRIDYIKFQLEEIDRAELIPGERKKLEEDLGLLKNASKIDGSISNIIDVLYEDERSAYLRISSAMTELAQLTTWTENAEEIKSSIEGVRLTIEEGVRNLTTIRENLEVDPNRIDGVIERLELLKHLERKHGGNIEHILSYASAMHEELQQLENAESRTQELELALKNATSKSEIIAKKLSENRKKSAKKLQKAVESELDDLNMSGTQFVLDFEKTDLQYRGYDRATFLVSPNKGEAPKSIAKIASGGELSRIMLALKTVHSARDTVATYIFDEVDSGIGGSTADRVGDKLAKTAENHQVLCITHLAQIASRATHQYVVEKIELEGRTASTIRPLNSEERIEEIARMLGGERVTNKTREAAKELLG